jgi:hypothetical protein
MIKTAFLTTASRNYLKYVVAFAQSAKRHHPNVDIFCLIVDAFDPSLRKQGFPFKLISIDDLCLANKEKLLFKYDVLCLNTTLKPYCMQYLYEKLNYDKVLYFDSDIHFFSDIDNVLKLLDNYDIVLTPHLTSPAKHKQTELIIMQCGIYNLGFIGTRKSKETLDMLKWWSERLYYYGNDDPPAFTDQKWCSLMPCYTDKVYILRDIGCNIAWWNLLERGPLIKWNNGKPTVGDVLVKFFHFSGCNINDINKVSKHQNYYTLKDFPVDLYNIYNYYKNTVIESSAQTEKYNNVAYAYDHYVNGIKIEKAHRNILVKLDIKDNNHKYTDPFRDSFRASQVPTVQRKKPWQK